MAVIVQPLPCNYCVSMTYIVSCFIKVPNVFTRPRYFLITEYSASILKIWWKIFPTVSVVKC